MTDEEAIEKQAALSDFAELQSNEAWKTVIFPFIQEQHQTALEGVTRQASTPAGRAEWIEAYHLTNALLKMVPNQIASLRRQLTQFQEQAKNRPLL